MDVLTGLVVYFWPVWLLVLLRPALGLVTATLFAAVRTSVDRGIAHDLPRNTGDWLRDRLRSRGLEGHVDVLTSPVDQGAVDAFFPGSSFIQLSAETWLRTDAVGWATAAHELGHALNYRRAPAMHALLVCARWGSRAAWTVGIAFVLANVLFGSALLAQVAFALLLVAATLNTTVVWDELWASQVGMAELRSDGRLDTRQLDGAHMTMGAAFLSYASGLAGTLGVVLAYPRVADLTLAHALYVPGAALAGPWLTAAVALSIALVGKSILEMVRLLRPSRYASATEAEAAMASRSAGDALWTVPLVGLLALVWNQPLGPGFAVAFALAALPALQIAVRVLAPALPLLMLPLFLVLMPVLSWVMPDGEPMEPLDPMTSDLVEEVRVDMERGHAELRVAQLRMVNDPPMYMRLGGLVRLSYVPLLIVLWSWLATSPG